MNSATPFATNFMIFAPNDKNKRKTTIPKAKRFINDGDWIWKDDVAKKGDNVCVR